MSQVESKSISVVVQGPVYHQDGLTKRVLESVREHLPDAELILSTWKGSDVSGLDYDILVENEDPGEIPHKFGSKNLNRQLISTAAGLNVATKKYAMKLRTDTILKSVNFLKLYLEYGEGLQGDIAVFRQRVFVAKSFTNNPLNRCGLQLNFHPSDIWQFGLREDLLQLWSANYLNSEEIMNKVTSEQYYFISLLSRKGFDVCFNDADAIDPKKVILSEKIMLKNFVILNNEQISILLPSRLEEMTNDRKKILYTFEDWKRIQQKRGAERVLRDYYIYARIFWRKYKRKFQQKRNEDS